MAGFAAALVDAGGAVQAGDVLPMRLDPSFVVPQTALPESWRGRTEMTNFYPVAGAGALDVIRSEAAAFGGVAEVTTGELTFALTAEDGRELWSSGPLKAGARALRRRRERPAPRHVPDARDGDGGVARP